MKVMMVKRNSWHYKILASLCYERPDNLCEYFWTLFFNINMIVSWFALSSPFIFAAGWGLVFMGCGILLSIAICDRTRTLAEKSWLYAIIIQALGLTLLQNVLSEQQVYSLGLTILEVGFMTMVPFLCFFAYWIIYYVSINLLALILGRNEKKKKCAQSKITIFLQAIKQALCPTIEYVDKVTEN